MTGIANPYATTTVDKDGINSSIAYQGNENLVTTEGISPLPNNPYQTYNHDESQQRYDTEFSKQDLAEKGRVHLFSQDNLEDSKV